MKQTTIAIAVVVIFGSALIIHDRYRLANTSSGHSATTVSHHADTEKVTLRAAGRIEGRTEEVELLARISEQISEIRVTRGQWVNAGTVLVSLDAGQLVGERDLAEALLSLEQAKRQRLVNGYRSSEIEVARHEYQSAAARLAGAEKTHARAMQLAHNEAISGQSMDDYDTNLNSLRALAAAAKGKLETLELPAREDELLAADASIRAAASRLQIAQVNLDRAQIRAPIDGMILTINGEVGELTGPESPQPLVVMSDTRRLRAIAEIDEFDALRVQLGQSCVIECDAKSGIVARGRVAVIEPQMLRKRLVGQWAGERTDTYSRRVWLDLEQPVDLPVGMPVDVFIEACELSQP